MHSSAHHHVGSPDTEGRILNQGWLYDLGTWLLDTILLRGKLRQMRQRAIDLAQIQPGDRVLDVGCGTGTLALEVLPRVGAAGRVTGIDPGTKQIARARSKAARRHLPVDFEIGVIEHLTFPDQTFDAVLSTLMMHHLPDDLKRRGLAEIARVLKPGGRLVIADFKGHPGQPAQLVAGASGVHDLPALIKAAGFSIVETDDMPLPHFVAHSDAGFVKAIKS